MLGQHNTIKAEVLLSSLQEQMVPVCLPGRCAACFHLLNKWKATQWRQNQEEVLQREREHEAKGNVFVKPQWANIIV